MATYRFRVSKAFGRVGIVEFQVDSAQEVELVKSFMLKLAPEIARFGLRADLSPADCAERALYWAMNMTAQYTTFQREALRAIETQNPSETESTPHPGLLEKETFGDGGI
jgi:hypothetical protein